MANRNQRPSQRFAVFVVLTQLQSCLDASILGTARAILQPQPLGVVDILTEPQGVGHSVPKYGKLLVGSPLWVATCWHAPGSQFHES